MPLLLVDEGAGASQARLHDLLPIVKALLSLIPAGRVTTYSSISRLLGVHPRVVGRLMALNDEPIVYPCHRVVRSDGSLGGYSRGGVRVKRRLLELEGVGFDERGRVRREFIVDMKEVLDIQSLEAWGQGLDS